MLTPVELEEELAAAREEVSRLRQENRNLVRRGKTFGLHFEYRPDKYVKLAHSEVPILSERASFSFLHSEQQSPHMLIKGDNYAGLISLLPAYAGKIDVIYIDPPYNTGNDGFIYDDKHLSPDDLWKHSTWLSFMQPRLKLAKQMLAETGSILVSIDDNEQAELKLLMDEIFGSENLIQQFVWRTDGNFDNQAQVKSNHEYVLFYAKSKEHFRAQSVVDPNLSEDSKVFNPEIVNSVIKNGPKNPVSSVLLPIGFPASFKSGTVPPRQTSWPHFDKAIAVEDWQVTEPVAVESGWANGKMLRQFISNDFAPLEDTKGQSTIFRLTATGAIENVKTRSESQSHVVSVLMNMGTTEKAGIALKRMGVNFSYPKPVQLIKYLLRLSGTRSATVLDFFAGSGSTGQAVAELNAEDGGERHFILITDAGKSLDKPAEPDIAEEITYPRLRRALTGQGWPDAKIHLDLKQGLRMFDLVNIRTKLPQVVVDWNEDGNPVYGAGESRSEMDIIEEMKTALSLDSKSDIAITGYRMWKKIVRSSL